MPYNARLLARARARLSDIREENAAERQKRLRNVYFSVPEIEAIDNFDVDRYIEKMESDPTNESDNLPII